jgi:HEAT repeat protein
MTLALAAREQAPATRAWALLQQGARDQNHVTRVSAVEALGLLVGDDRARGLAESALTDEESAVRAAACTALGLIGLKSSGTALQKAAIAGKEAEVVFADAAVARLEGGSAR